MILIYFPRKKYGKRKKKPERKIKTAQKIVDTFRQFYWSNISRVDYSIGKNYADISIIVGKYLIKVRIF